MNPVILLAVVITAMLAVSWVKRAPPPVRQRILRQALIGGAAGLLFLLAVTGRLPWLFAVVGVLIPVAQRLLAASRIYRAARGASGGASATGGRYGGPGGGPAGGSASGPRSEGRTSSVETHFLRMWLDHSTGKMGGTVLEGRFRGRTLDELDLDELLDLLSECQDADQQSTAVLEAFLDRERGPAWRERHRARAQGGRRPASSQGMTAEEAWQVLGLEPGSDKNEVIRAHRRLMQKLHPDHGGSDYLAAKINRAKDTLLGP